MDLHILVQQLFLGGGKDCPLICWLYTHVPYMRFRYVQMYRFTTSTSTGLWQVVFRFGLLIAFCLAATRRFCRTLDATVYLPNKCIAEQRLVSVTIFLYRFTISVNAGSKQHLYPSVRIRPNNLGILRIVLGIRVQVKFGMYLLQQLLWSCMMSESNTALIQFTIVPKTRHL